MAIAIRSEGTAHCRICNHSEIIIPLSLSRDDIIDKVKKRMRELGWIIEVGECLCPNCAKNKNPI